MKNKELADLRKFAKQKENAAVKKSMISSRNALLASNEPVFDDYIHEFNIQEGKRVAFEEVVAKIDNILSPAKTKTAGKAAPAADKAVPAKNKAATPAADKVADKAADKAAPAAGKAGKAAGKAVPAAGKK